MPVPNQSTFGYRGYWGQYGTVAELPNTAGAAFQNTNLALGDTAYVTGAGVGLYVCIGDAMGAAVWLGPLATGAPTGGRVELRDTAGNITFFSTITAALAAAGAGDLVLVGPGAFAESITIPADVKVEAIGEEATQITGTGSGFTVSMNANATLVGFEVTAPDDAAGGGVTRVSTGRAVLDNCVINGAGPNARGLVVSQGALLSKGQLVFTGEFDAGIFQDGGTTLINNPVYRLITAMATAFEVTAGPFNLVNPLIALNTPVTTVLSASGTAFVQIANMDCRAGTTAIEILSDDVECVVRNSQITEDVTTHISVDAAVTDARLEVSGTFDLTRVDMPAAFFSAAQLVLDAVNSSNTDDNRVGNRTLLGELRVGQPEQGFESVFGEGDSYTRGMVVLTTDATAGAGSDGGNFIDVSAEAASPSGSTFTFQGLGANHTILIASSLENAAGVLRHWGHRWTIDTAKVGGTVVLEYWDGAAWAVVPHLQTLRNAPYTPQDPDMWTSTDGVHMRAGIFTSNMLGVDGTVLTPQTWTAKTINGMGPYFWLRYRVTSVMTTAPVFEQVRLHTSRMEINSDGFLELFGEGRRRNQLDVHQRLTDDLSGASPGNVAITFGTGLTITPQDNQFVSNANDGFGIIIQIPFGVDSSLPMLLRLGWIPSNTDTGNVRFETEYRIIEEGDILATGQALTGTITEDVAAPGVTDQLEFYEVELDISQSVPGRSYIALGIQRLGPNAADTFTGNVEVAFFQGFAFQWSML